MKKLLLVSLLPVAGVAAAQSTNGALITLSAQTSIRVENDQAAIEFSAEEQDADRQQAITRLNQRMRTGTEQIKKSDPSAMLQTGSVYSYPVYDAGRAKPGKAPVIIAWRVGQKLDVKSADLSRLTSLVGEAQKNLQMTQLNFGLSDAAKAKTEQQKFDSGYKQFSHKLSYLLKAMGKSEAQAELAELNVTDMSGPVPEMKMMAMAAPMADGAAQNPGFRFEPGFSELNISIEGKVRLRKE